MAGGVRYENVLDWPPWKEPLPRNSWLTNLSNLAEAADPEAQAYLSELLDLHQSLDWAAAGPYLARRLGGEDDRAARAFVHCDRRLVEGRIGLHGGLGDPSFPYAAGVTATSATPESG